MYIDHLLHEKLIEANVWNEDGTLAGEPVPPQNEGPLRHAEPEQFCIISADGSLGNVTKIEGMDLSKKQPYRLLNQM